MALDDMIRIKHNLIRCCLSEFFGTLVLIFVASSAGASYATVTYGTTPSPAASVMGTTFAVGLAAFIALSGSIGVSGGHINPAITVAVAAMGHFPWAHVVPYLIAQHLGGFVAGILIYLTHMDAIEMIRNDYNGTLGYMKTATMFASAPAAHATNIGCFLNSFLATAVFLIGIAVTLDARNMKAPKWFWSFGVSLSLIIALSAFSGNGGPSVNPAGDLPMRLFASCVGWYDVIWQGGNGHYWYLCGLLGPHLGAIFGLYFYRLLIGAHFPKEEEDVIDETELRKLNKAG